MFDMVDFIEEQSKIKLAEKLQIALDDTEGETGYMLFYTEKGTYTEFTFYLSNDHPKAFVGTYRITDGKIEIIKARSENKW